VLYFCGAFGKSVRTDEIHLIEQTKKIDVYYDILEVWKTTHQLSELSSLDLFYQV
jgi:hypothetical protein